MIINLSIHCNYVAVHRCNYDSHKSCPVHKMKCKQFLEDFNMSDLAATNCGCSEERSGCGCGCDNGCGCNNNGCGCGNNGCGCGNNGCLGFNNLNNGNCNCILWLIIILCLSGCNGYGNNCNGCGSNDCSWLIIVLLLLSGYGGCGCGC